jgi:hypothetical protein
MSEPLIYEIEYFTIENGKISPFLNEHNKDTGKYSQHLLPKEGNVLEVDGTFWKVVAIEIPYKADHHPKIYLTPFPNFLEHLATLA